MDNSESLEQFFREKANESISKSNQELSSLIDEHIAAIDKLLSLQLREIFQHPKFKQIESTWRALHRLVFASDRKHVKIKVLNATKEEIHRDMNRAPRFDKSNIFHQICEKEYASFGGEPYSILLGDYYFDLKNPKDVLFLQNMSNGNEHLKLTHPGAK